MSDYVRERLRKIQEETVDAARHEAAIAVPPVKLNERTALLVDVGYVYFIRSGQSVKIGFSRDVKKRLQQLKTGAAHKVSILAAVPGTMDTEAYFHRMFAEYRMSGEWFRYEGELKRFAALMPARSETPDRSGAAYHDLSDEFSL